MEREAYLIIVSSIPALYRSLRDSPNDTTRSLNRALLDKAIAWAQWYQREVQGREPDNYEEFR